MCRLMPYFISYSQICVRINVHWVALKSSRTIPQNDRVSIVTEGLLIRLQITEWEMKDSIALHSSRIDYVVTRWELQYLIGARNVDFWGAGFVSKPIAMVRFRVGTRPWNWTGNLDPLLTLFGRHEGMARIFESQKHWIDDWIEAFRSFNYLLFPFFLFLKNITSKAFEKLLPRRNNKSTIERFYRRSCSSIFVLSTLFSSLDSIGFLWTVGCGNVMLASVHGRLTTAKTFSCALTSSPIALSGKHKNRSLEKGIHRHGNWETIGYTSIRW